MYFITVDSNNVINGIYNGDMDTVQRTTLEPTPGSVRVPDGAIPITDMCLAKLRTTPIGKVYKWDAAASCVVEAPLNNLEEAQRQLLEKSSLTLIEQENSRILGLTLEQVLSELGGE